MGGFLVDGHEAQYFLKEGFEPISEDFSDGGASNESIVSLLLASESGSPPPTFPPGVSADGSDEELVSLPDAGVFLPADGRPRKEVAEPGWASLLRSLPVRFVVPPGTGTGGRQGAVASAALQVIAQDLAPKIDEDEDGSSQPLFFMYDLGMLKRLYEAWVGAMPRVAPFYAVKCNPNRGILAMLASLGAGFDCASRAELESVVSLGVPSERIIFANPVKFARDLSFAASHGISATFDSVAELAKVARCAPSMRLLLRVRSDDPTAICALGNKYGAEMEEVPTLLAAAASMGMAVVGVSFHVGSGARDPAAFGAAIHKARLVFDAAKEVGFNLSVLDIGGGMSCRIDPMDGRVLFNGFPEVVMEALDRLFPASEGVRVIGEPGRYFAQRSGTMAARIFGSRQRATAAPAPNEYWISDGIYGSFNCLMYDHPDTPVGYPLRSPHLPPVSQEDDSTLLPSRVWGPTCDGLDVVEKEALLPELREGDWLMYSDFGAYTIAGSTDFNGIRVSNPHVAYIYTA